MQNIFTQVQKKGLPKNVFDLSHDHKLSCKMGQLVPTMCVEVLPGDKWTLGCESMVRMAPMVNPVMHRMDVFQHYFFVPYRLLWSNWEDFITGMATPAFPTMDVSNTPGVFTRLMDHLGIPPPPVPPATPTVEVISAMPLAAYQFIYQEYYRDQNLVADVNYELINGSNDANTDLGELRLRSWNHDYFTSALPFAQKGTPVTYPLSIQDVRVSSITNVPGNVGNEIIWDNVGSDIAQSNTIQAESDVFAGVGDLFIKGDQVVGDTTIADLRRAFRLQEFLELDARGGTRYSESIYAHFGVKSPDARLQRPEYITGMKTPMMISEVVNTAGFDNGTEVLPQGNMAGHGISVGDGGYGSYYATEHGVIMCIMSVMPKTAYQQGIPKQFLKTTDRYQFYWNEFAHIGEQPIENRELYAYTLTGGDPFGYTPRYVEYKYLDSRVSGDFRDSLDSWHLGRIFSAQPALNQEFIECIPDQRIFAIESEEDYLYAHVLHKVRATRLMPKFGNPGF